MTRQVGSNHDRAVRTPGERPASRLPDRPRPTVDPRALDAPASGGQAKEASRRLVVDLNKRSAADLAWLVEAEETNRTVIVNRAIQVFAMLMEAQYQGRSVALVDNGTGDGQFVRLVL